MAVVENSVTPLEGHAISSVHAFSTGWAEQHEEHRFGTWKPRIWWVLLSRSWVKLPINYFLIEHSDGLVLFDAGLDPALVYDPGYIKPAIGRFLLRRLFRFHISEADALDRQLADAGFDASHIRLAVFSHLHFDHVGGIAQIPQARLIISEREWAQLSESNPEKEWILREHLEIPGAQWQPIQFQPTDDPLFDGFEGIHDVAGDGSMIILPTPGHTPGSLSMLIRRNGWMPILLVGDLSYEARLLDEKRVPGTGDAATLQRTFSQVKTLRERLGELAIVPSHDFGAADAIARATNSEKPLRQGGAG